MPFDGLIKDRAIYHAAVHRHWHQSRAMTSRLVDALLPPRCFDCGAGVAAQGDLCGDCWGRLSFITAPHCALCGYPFEFAAGDDTANGTGGLCGSCLRRRPMFDTARAALRYDDASRRLILGFKYSDRTAGTRAFGRWLGRLAQLPDQGDQGDNDTNDSGELLIMPVPLHPRRLWRRRYNQSALIAASLGRDTGIAVNLLDLVRHKDTPTQGGLNARQRFRNVRAAFSLRDGAAAYIAGRHILLIDDVLTTGATAEACSRVLKRSGAACVSLLALARVVRPTGEPI